jgi:hypothetical protein
MTFAKIVAAVRGRHTLFAIIFLICGHIMAWFNKLSPTYIGFMSALMSFVLGHSIQENYFSTPTPTTTTTQVATPNAVATQTTTSAPPSTPAPG